MAGDDDEVTPPGWYRQPDDPTRLRWWDGEDWTDDTMPVPGSAAGEPRSARAGRAGSTRRGDDAATAERSGPRRTRRDLMEAAEAEARGGALPQRSEEPTADTTAEVPIVAAGRPGEARSRRPRRAEPEPSPRRAGGSGDRDAGRTTELEILVPPTADGDGPRPALARGRSPKPEPSRSAPDRRRDAATASVDPGYRRGPTETVRVVGGDEDWPEPERRSLRAADGDWVASTWEAEAAAAAGRPAKGTPRPGPGSQRGRSGPPARRAPGPRPPGADARRPSARGARVREETAPAPPQLGKVLVRAALIAVLIGVGYLGYVRLRDAAPNEAATLSADPAPDAVDPDAPRLDQILLTLADLPRGWSAVAVDPSSDDICDGRVPRSVIKPTDLKSANFTLGDSGSIIGNVVQEFSNEGQAKDFMDLTADVVDACRSYGSGESTISLQPFDFPKFGDETFVAQVTGTSPGGESHGAIVYLRVDNRVSSVVTVTFGEGAVNKELIEHLTQLVSHRMTTKPEVGDPPEG